MESCGSGADCPVGSIVWVRRRNGSWWPGRIMGPDDLSANHHISPRTGTPVKLLGREDASVDWYNLEKSKRVKEFRCGEFDECIRRAESSLGMPAKKREKYARREDAILHALELEKEILEKEHGQPKLSDFNNIKYSDYAAPLKTLRFENAKPDQFSTGSDSSPKEENSNLFYVPPKDKEANSNKKFSSFGTNGAQRFLTENHTYATSSNGVSMGCTTINGNFTNLLEVRKRPNERLIKDIHAKRRSDFLDNKENVSKQIKAFAAERECGRENTSEFTNDEHSYSSETEDLDTETDEETNSLSGSSDTDSDILGESEFQAKHESGAHEDLSPHYHAPINRSMSKWQNKGKRNVRYLSKKLDHGSYIEEQGITTFNRNWTGHDRVNWEDQRYVEAYSKMRPMLIDVDLEVQASYKKRFPIVSLMSKIDGKAIIGHPIQIEVIKEGSSQTLFTVKNEFLYNEGDRTIAPMWRTSRRTARIPRPHPSSVSAFDEATEDLPQTGQKRKPIRSSSDRKFSKKVPKKVSFSSNKKTRTLSSIGINHNKLEDYSFDGIIKTDSVSVACIPVKLVFSRLYETVGRAQSRAAVIAKNDEVSLVNMITETNP